MSRSSVHNHDDENTSNVGQGTHNQKKSSTMGYNFLKYPKRLMRELNYKDSVFNVKMMGLHQL